MPGAVATEARGVNNLGEIVGFYKTAACSDYDITVPNCAARGFKFVNNTFVKLMVPNSTSEAFRFGFWVGVFKQGKDNDFFKYKGGDTRFTGVNDKADIFDFAAGATIGFYAQNIEAGEGTGDATETKLSYTVLQFPGNSSASPATIPFGINNVRGIVGTYRNPAGRQHGFLAKASSFQYLYVANSGSITI